MILKMAHVAKNEGVVRLYKSNDPDHFADGEQLRDFIYLKDAVGMTIKFLMHPIFGIYNIGQGKPTSWNELAAALFKALNKEKRIEYIEMPKELKEKYQNYTCADMKKTNSVLKLKTTSLPEAVREYVQDYILPNARW